jgi:hypothetical protein
MATRALHFEEFRLEVIDEGLPAIFGCGGPLYDYEMEDIDEVEPVDEAEAERQWIVEELAFADEEEEEADEHDPSYYRSDMSDESSYEESLLTPTDESPMQDQDAPFSVVSRTSTSPHLLGVSTLNSHLLTRFSPSFLRPAGVTQGRTQAGHPGP